MTVRPHRLTAITSIRSHPATGFNHAEQADVVDPVVFLT
jgi:hypothetical protein